MDHTARLPNELMEMIFERLGLRTLVGFRLVCKRWRSLVDSFRYRGDLAISPPTVKRWFFTGEPIQPDVFIHYFLVESLTDGSVSFDLTRLRRLAIHGLEPDQLEQLNGCTPNLMHLEIGSTSFPTESALLDLPKLEVLLLSWTHFKATESRLSINSPKLKTLGINCDPKKRIRISNPESLEYLKFSVWTDKQDLSEYKNLKTLCFWSAESIGRDVLRQLPRLQKAVFGEASKAFLYRPDLWTAGDLVDHLMDEKRQLNRTDFNLVFADTRISDDKRFSDYDFKEIYPNFSW